jgi:hypothetical protein
MIAIRAAQGDLGASCRAASTISVVAELTRPV